MFDLLDIALPRITYRRAGFSIFRSSAASSFLFDDLTQVMLTKFACEYHFVLCDQLLEKRNRVYRSGIKGKYMWFIKKLMRGYIGSQTRKLILSDPYLWYNMRNQVYKLKE